MWTTIPLTLIPLIIFNLGGATWDRDPDRDPWAWPLWNLRLPSSATWSLTSGDALICLGIMFLFIEVLKATRTSDSSLVDHLFSTFTFVIYLVEFLVVPYTAHSVFFILTLIAFVDVVGGFSITIRGARRDVNYDN